jgi:glutamate racemase
MRNPIGVFDSGLGGLTVVKHLSLLLPHENIVYLGDTARVPYGTRSKTTIEKFSFEDANFLLRKKVKCIIIACNTSSALAGEKLKKKIKIPVLDVITPALKCARSISKNGKIGVIGTRGTIESGAYKVQISMACPLFVPFIEEGNVSGKALEVVAHEYLKVFKSKNIDTLILGCTHYPIIKNIIQKEVGNKITLIDSGKTAAEEIKESKLKGKKEFYVTDLTKQFVKTAEMFLGEKVKNNLRKIDIIEI